MQNSVVDGEFGSFLSLEGNTGHVNFHERSRGRDPVCFTSLTITFSIAAWPVSAMPSKPSIAYAESAEMECQLCSWPQLCKGGWSNNLPQLKARRDKGCRPCFSWHYISSILILKHKQDLRCMRVGRSCRGTKAQQGAKGERECRKAKVLGGFVGHTAAEYRSSAIEKKVKLKTTDFLHHRTRQAYQRQEVSVS